VRIASRLVGPAAAASDLAGVRFELKWILRFANEGRGGSRCEDPAQFLNQRSRTVFLLAQRYL